MKTAHQSEISETIRNLESSLHELKGKSLLISGATGFFGKWLCQILISANKQLDLNLSLTLITRDKDRVLEEQPWLREDFLDFITGDIRTFQISDRKFDFIIHGATAASAALNDSNPDLMADTIIEGTKRILLQAASSQKPKFLFISSGAVYGAQRPEISHMPEDNSYGPDISKVSNAYGEAKRMAELYCQFAQVQNKISLSIARCYAFVGPYLPLDQHFAAGNFIRDVLEQKAIVLTGDGTPYRSYMYPTDLVEWLITILVKAPDGAIYNVGSDEEVQLGSLAKVVSRFSSPPVEVKILGKANPSAKRNAYVPSVEKAKKELGLNIRVGLEDALRRTISWHKNSK